MTEINHEIQKEGQASHSSEAYRFADFGYLMRLASALGKAKIAGCQEQIAIAQRAHDDYLEICRSASELHLGWTYGALSEIIG